MTQSYSENFSFMPLAVFMFLSWYLKFVLQFWIVRCFCKFRFKQLWLECHQKCNSLPGFRDVKFESPGSDLVLFLNLFLTNVYVCSMSKLMISWIDSYTEYTMLRDVISPWLFLEYWKKKYNLGPCFWKMYQSGSMIIRYESDDERM